MIFSVEKEGQIFQTEYVPDRVFPAFRERRPYCQLAGEMFASISQHEQGQRKEFWTERDGSVLFKKEMDGEAVLRPFRSMTC